MKKKVFIFIIILGATFSSAAVVQKGKALKLKCKNLRLAPHIQYIPVLSLVGECFLNPSSDKKAHKLKISNPISPYFVLEADFNKFYNCAGSGCIMGLITKMESHEVESVRELFLNPATSAEEERQKIALAIGIFEYFVGRQKEVNTWGDKGRNDRSFIFSSREGLGHDCIAESHNTLSYLLILEKNSLLRFHKVENIVYRRQPHYAVKIQEKKTKASFVVDSWFLNNGYPAVILGLDSWKRGDSLREKQAIFQAKKLFYDLPDELKNFLKNNNLLER